MAVDELLKPTLHVEVQLKSASTSLQYSHEICDAVKVRLTENYEALQVGQSVGGFDGVKHEENICCVEIADYTGPENTSFTYALASVQLDVQAYALRPEVEPDPRRRIKQLDDDETPQIRILALPNVSLHEAWGSLVFEDGLPARLLRYLVRMVDMMGHPDLNLGAFNWNRLCLLHGPPGSGKSTLCRALAQKLSIRLGNKFTKAMFAEVNTNSMLSKYFGESGKQIESMFEHIYSMCRDRKTFVCVVMDEVETIAGSRERAAEGSECSDGLRATNQLLTALDRLRNLPNVIMLCTSNLIEAIDPAFLDRVDIKQFIPSPSSSAIYNIFRSCFIELVRSSVVDHPELRSLARSSQNDATVALAYPSNSSSSPHGPRTRSRVASKTRPLQRGSCSPTLEALDSITFDIQDVIPTFTEMMAIPDPESPGGRVWSLAQKCHGFSGRTLRRLPVLALAMYTWVGQCSLEDAISALEKAVEQELAVVKLRAVEVEMGGNSDPKTT